MDFDKVRNIAVVGISDKPDRASNRVARYLQDQGFRVIPVNPGLKEALGEQCYPDLAAIPPDVKLDVVDIFRQPEAVPAIVDQAVRRGDQCTIWMQEGVVHEAAARQAEAAGLEVVMDRCILKAHLQRGSSR